MPRFLGLMASLLLSVLAGCAQNPANLPTSNAQQLPPPKMEYLGVAGFLLRWQGEALLFAPSFSNPQTLGAPPVLVKTDRAKVDAMMPKADDVSMVLVGHAHYDHLLDVPYVMQKYTPKAKVYGSQTMGHILAAALPRERIVDAQSVMADGRTPGQWFYSPNRRIRAMPIKSEHAPHIFGIKFLGGQYTQDLTELPTTTWGWKEGQTLAWLVDLLDEQGRPLYRIHYQDAASTPPIGLPPQLDDSKPVDVAILCVGAWDQVPAYPSVLLKRLKPRVAILSHWEDFFGGDLRHPEALRLQDIDGILQITRQSLPSGSVVKLPMPFSEVALPAPQP